jgi:uncharacterized protein (TIGR00255 family)
MPTLYSMTGYAVEAADLPEGALTLELRAVNSRFLDLAFKMGEEFRALEPLLRERLTDRVRRGKLECRIHFSPRQDSNLDVTPNAVMLARLGQLSASVRAVLPDAQPLQIGEVLRWPGMLGDNTPDPESLQEAALKLIDTALADFNASRAREGSKLKVVILERVKNMRLQVADLRPRVPVIIAAFREKLGKRMEEMLKTSEPERLLQEVALFAQKIDVDEELDRLSSHLTEVERVLDAGGAAGKRLDFLMQELHREANTLGSKAASLELSQTSVELKVLIEQMREQVQNLE